MRKKLLSLLLVAVMAASCLTGCGSKPSTSTTESTVSKETTTTVSTETKTEKKDETPLVVGYSPFSSKFSPFFSETAYDQDAYAMTQISLMGNDRQGAMVYNGIEGETNNYNGTDYTYYGPANVVVTENADGTVYYDIKLRDDIKFSDGELMNIDDVIFSMYVLCDPTYDGSSTLFAQPIEGMEAYRAGMDTLFNLLVAAGRDNADYTYWDAATQTAFWADLDQAGAAFAQEIADYCVAYGATNVSEGAALWGFGGLPAEATAADEDANAAAVTQVWAYVGELAFNMLVLVGSVKMSDRIIREMRGL